MTTRKNLVNLDMNGNRITNIGTPVEASDAVTKGYIDSLAGSGSADAYVYDQPNIQAGQFITISRYRENTITVNLRREMSSEEQGSETLQFDPTPEGYTTEGIAIVEKNQILSSYTSNPPTGYDIYVDAVNGNDANDGSTPETAKKTLEPILADIWLNPDTYPDPVKIFLNDGVYELHALNFKNNYGIEDVAGTVCFPLGKNMEIYGKGLNTKIICYGDVSLGNSKRTYGIKARYVDSATTWNIRLENLNIRFKDMNPSGTNYESPMFRGSAADAGKWYITARNCTFVNIDGYGLFYDNDSGCTLDLQNCDLNGLFHDLSSYGSIATVNNGNVYVGYVNYAAVQDQLLGYEGERTEAGWDEWLFQNQNTFFYELVSYDIGEGYGRATGFYDTTEILKFESAQVFFSQPQGEVRVCLKAKDSSLNDIYFKYNSSSNTWEITDGNAINWITAAEFNNIPASAWSNLKAFLDANGLAGIALDAYIKNTANDSTPIFDYWKMTIWWNKCWVPIQEDIKIYPNSVKITFSNPYSLVRVEIVEV